MAGFFYVCRLVAIKAHSAKVEPLAGVTVTAIERVLAMRAFSGMISLRAVVLPRLKKGLSFFAAIVGHGAILGAKL